MDGLTLLRRARDAGLQVEAAGDKLLIRGPKSAGPIVRLLAEHKAEVLAALASTELLAPLPWFERAVPPLEGEPGMEAPCPSRRGRVQELGRAFLHFCEVCGAFGAFGYGVNLRAGQVGRWYCAAHRPRRGPVKDQEPS